MRRKCERQVKIRLIAKTEYFPQKEVELDTTEGSQAVIEFAGRSCYSSWNKPNPETKTNKDYLKHILDVAHYSVLEHGSCTFYVEGVSRALTHELIRHRHLSYSQLSQRFVPADGNMNLVLPPFLEDNPMAMAAAFEASRAVNTLYSQYHAMAEEKLKDLKLPKTMKKKRAREAARAALMNMTETKIVVTGNHRGWREFLSKRAEWNADLEIRRFAVGIFRFLVEHFPNIYQDLEVFTEEDGYRSVRLAG